MWSSGNINLECDALHFDVSNIFLMSFFIFLLSWWVAPEMVGISFSSFKEITISLRVKILYLHTLLNKYSNKFNIDVCD